MKKSDGVESPGVVSGASIGEPTLGTVGRAAEILDVHPRTVRRLVDAGVLRAVRIGRARRIDLSSVRSFIKAGGVACIGGAE